MEAVARDPDSLRMELEIVMETKDRGEFLFILKCGEGNEEPITTNLTFPQGTGRYDNDNLDRVMEAMRPFFSSEKTLFRSILDSEGNLTLKNTIFNINRGEKDFELRFSGDFDYGESIFSREFNVLTFTKHIGYPKLDTDDPLSVSRYNNFVAEVKLCSVHLSIDPGDGNSMDLQFETPGHDRTPTGESARIHTDLHGIRSGGNGVKITHFFLFSPGVLFPVLVGITLTELISIAAIWWRNRFRGVGLILPSFSVLMVPTHLLLFFNPQVNIYSTHDIFVFGSVLVTISLISASFFVNPEHERKKIRSYEEEKGPDLEMPRVVYSRKNVYIRSKESGGIDPYEIIGVTRNMSTEDILEEYRRQVLKFHPDRFHSSPENVKEMAERETGRLNRAIEMITSERKQ